MVVNHQICHRISPLMFVLWECIVSFCICIHIYIDIFIKYRSFGVLIWEIATYGEVPHSNLQTRDIIEMAANGTLRVNRWLTIMHHHICIYITLGSILYTLSPVGCPEILASLISQCTRIQSEDRPTFTELLKFCNEKDFPTTIGNFSSASFRI